MSRRFLLLLLVFLQFLSLVPGTAFADSYAIPSTIVPKGVTEIDLRISLGDEGSQIEDAWMLPTDSCVLLRRLPKPKKEKYIDPDCYEIIVLNTRTLAILSRTPIPPTGYVASHHIEDDTLYLFFVSIEYEWNTGDPENLYIVATVTADGTTHIGSYESLPAGGYVTSIHRGRDGIVMPGSTTAIYTAIDGSLYVVELATGKEELLISGVSGRGVLEDLGYDTDAVGMAERFPFVFEGYEDALAAYVPFWDELPENVGEGDLSAWSPGEHGYDIVAIRQFHACEPLDEYRFVYEVNGWEWGAGFGVYDLKTRTNHRITGQGYFLDVAENTIYGEYLQADVDTYQTTIYPKEVQAQLIDANPYNFNVSCEISPKGKLLALMGMKYRDEDENADTVTFTDIQTGQLLKAYNIYNPFAWESHGYFYSETQFMMFFAPNTEVDSAYIYLFDITK